jgi:enhancer of polycomb-like protein
LQEVLSAAHRTQVTKKTEEKPKAYIPTPEANGVADNVSDLYPPNRWRDPATYICTSTGVEESVANGIGGGFTYYMDERDKEWLDKNNEEARGEGTSAQGAVSASGTRTSARSSKAKGKEPDVAQPIALTEDEFELVMGLFEKITHDKTEFLHHVCPLVACLLTCALMNTSSVWRQEKCRSRTLVTTKMSSRLP